MGCGVHGPLTSVLDYCSCCHRIHSPGHHKPFRSRRRIPKGDEEKHNLGQRLTSQQPISDGREEQQPSTSKRLATAWSLQRTDWCKRLELSSPPQKEGEARNICLHASYLHPRPTLPPLPRPCLELHQRETVAHSSSFGINGTYVPQKTQTPRDTSLIPPHAPRLIPSGPDLHAQNEFLYDWTAEENTHHSRVIIKALMLDWKPVFAKWQYWSLAFYL